MIAEHLGPLVNFPVRRDYNRSLLIEFTDEREKRIGLFLRHRKKADFIDDENAEARDVCSIVSMLSNPV
jgi:hypothetical protein